MLVYFRESVRSKCNKNGKPWIEDFFMAWKNIRKLCVKCPGLAYDMLWPTCGPAWQATQSHVKQSKTLHRWENQQQTLPTMLGFVWLLNLAMFVWWRLQRWLLTKRRNYINLIWNKWKCAPLFVKLVKLVTVSFQDLRSMLWQGEVQRHRALVEHLNGWRFQAVSVWIAEFNCKTLAQFNFKDAHVKPRLGDMTPELNRMSLTQNPA